MLPGSGSLLKQVTVEDRDVARVEAIICSMTTDERRDPKIISGSRKRRIATGSGTTPTDVNRLLSQFAGAQKMMKMLAGGRGLPGMAAGALGMGNRGSRSTGPKSVNRKKKTKGRR